MPVGFVLVAVAMSGGNWANVDKPDRRSPTKLDNDEGNKESLGDGHSKRLRRNGIPLKRLSQRESQKTMITTHAHARALYRGG